MVSFKILGPLEIDGDAGAVQPDGSRPWVLLCALLTKPNDVVSVDTLTEWLWPYRVPQSAPAVIQVYVSRLRRVLEPHRRPWSTPRVLLYRAPGYLLKVQPDQLDSLRFARLAEAGRLALESGRPEVAAEVLREALGLWRGRALADVSLRSAAQDDIALLEGRRLSATVMRIEADLALGRHLALVPELDALVREHPLDERLCAQLMIALYRCGRQADALAAYRSMRERLARELGIGPAPATERLCAAIRSQHPDLEPVRRAAMRPAPGRGALRRTGRLTPGRPIRRTPA